MIDVDIYMEKSSSNNIILILLADPSMVLPSLINLVYSTDEKVQLASSGSLLSVLKHHNQNADVICMLLDCLM